jgi:hypothetical protein
MKTILLLLFCFSVPYLYAQYVGALEINHSKVYSWVESDISNDEGVYHFGVNDGSKLILLINDGNITIIHAIQMCKIS